MAKKRKSDDSDDSGTSKQPAREESIDEIVQTLREKHGEDYSVPQYRMWARMKLNGHHSSLEEAPPYPLFNGGHKKPPEKTGFIKRGLTSCTTAVVRQLERLKALQQVGVLTAEEFEEQNAYILKNIHELNN